MSKVIQVDDKKIKLQIWDTAGQDRFQNITKTYYKGASGIILTYAVDDKESLNNINTWNRSIDDYAGENIVRILIGNKCDMEDRCIDYSEGKEMAEKYDIKFFETSAKENQGIEEAFFAIAKEIKDCIEDDRVNNGNSNMLQNHRKMNGIHGDGKNGGGAIKLDPNRGTINHKGVQHQKNKRNCGGMCGGSKKH